MKTNQNEDARQYQVFARENLSSDNIYVFVAKAFNHLEEVANEIVGGAILKKSFHDVFHKPSNSTDPAEAVSFAFNVFRFSIIEKFKMELGEATKPINNSRAAAFELLDGEDINDFIFYTLDQLHTTLRQRFIKGHNEEDMKFELEKFYLATYSMKFILMERIELEKENRELAKRNPDIPRAKKRSESEEEE